MVQVADAHYENPRLAALYDPLDSPRPDLEVYAALAAESGARTVLDIGCGTGTFFESDGAVLTADSTLRFRGRQEVTNSLAAAGFTVAEIRDAPDRPGLEFVFIATVMTP